MRFALLLLLAIERGKPMQRTSIVELLWPGTEEPNGRHSLRHVAYVLRQAGAPLTERSSSIELSADAVELDFETMLGPAELPSEGFRDFLPGYAPTFSAAFSEWVEAQRSRVHARIRSRLLTVLAQRRERGQWGDVEELAKDCLRLDPLNEHATLALAEATAMNGGKAAAIVLLDHFLAELGATPASPPSSAALLRKRIAERLVIPYSAASECFVGRENTLSLLTGKIRQARSGQGAACLLWGPAGIGKSRVVLEASRIATLDGVRTLRAGCQPTDSRRPLSVFVDLLPQLLNLPGSLGCSPTNRQYLSRQTRATPEDGPVGFIPADANQNSGLSYAQTRQAIVDLLRAISDETPLMLVVEDVHWIDRSSAQMLRDLVERIQNVPVQIVITSRHAPVAPSPLSGQIAGLTVHEIRPLNDRDARHLLASVAGSAHRPSEPVCLARALALAEGNPFFLRELATTWALTGDTLQLPASLTAALDERLNELDVVSLRVLQACSLLGKNATASRIERILEYSRIQLLDCFQSLDGLNLLSADGSQIEVRHDLIGDAAASRLSRTARRFLHGCIGAVLEADAHPERPAVLWGCAWHLKQAGEGAKALAVLKRCAQLALDAGSPKRAVAILEQAAEMCSTDEESSQVRTSLIMALRSAGLWTRILDVNQAGSAAPDDSERRPVHDDAELAILEARWDTKRDLPVLLQQAQVCLAASDAPTAHRVKAGIWALILAHNLPDAGVATKVYECLEQIGRSFETSETEMATADLIYHTAFGDLGFGAASGSRLVSITRKGSDPASLSRVLRLAAVPLIYLGRFSEARTLLREALDILESRELEWGMFATIASLVRCHFEEGDLVGSRQWYGRLRSLAESTRDPSIAYAALLQGAKIALIELRSDATEIATFPHWRDCVSIASTRAQSVALAVCALSALYTGLAAEHAQILPRLERAFSIAKASGDQDFAAFALYEARRAMGQEELAAATLRTYLENDRRERSLLPPYLSKVAASQIAVAGVLTTTLDSLATGSARNG